MKSKRKKKFLAILLLFVSFFSLLPTELTYAATSYTNAKEFYESTGLDGQNYHAKMINGTIYYATSARLASSSTNEKYYTLGFDITLSGNGHSVSFAVQRTGGSMIQLDSRISGGYEYILYAVQDYTLYNLATLSDAKGAQYVLSASKIGVTMNAIMTTKLGDSLRGGIVEDGAGGVYETGNVYHIGNSDDLKAMRNKFTGHDFNSYYDIYETLDNPSLAIRYNIQGTTGGTVSVADGFGMTDTGILTAFGNPYIQTNTLLQPVALLNPADIALTKPGYHLESGKEWVALNRVFTPSEIYMPKYILPEVVTGSRGITMYANWVENQYHIVYDSNGGDGYLPLSTVKYSENYKIKSNILTRKGYSLVEGAEWNTQPDGSGVSFSSNQIVSGLTTVDGEFIVLYAQWKPNVYEITTNQLEGSGGTPSFYEKYENGWYADKETTSNISKIKIPSRAGYDFLGYLPYIFGVGNTIVDCSGNIMVNPDYFDKDSIIYAMYQPKSYKITFNKMGGNGGTDTAAATYDEYLPYATAPLKTGYSFKGYYGNDKYTGDIYYLETMAPNIKYTFTKNITVYAKWVDDIEPSLGIAVDTTNWTNKASGINVKTYAYDLGSGLDKVELYCGDTLVAQKTGLKGTKKTVSLDHVHKTEGVYRYKVVAYDMNGNKSEKYEYVRYDIKAPNGTYDVTNPNVNKFSINVDAYDNNVK